MLISNVFERLEKQRIVIIRGNRGVLRYARHNDGSSCNEIATSCCGPRYVPADRWEVREGIGWLFSSRNI